MKKREGIREVTRNFSILDEYDNVEIEDKKAKETQKKLDEIKKFAGKGKIYKRFEGLTSKDIRAKIAEEKYG